ncbi:MAG: hypothetical protein L3J52_04860 [Proteobacteria bacterium]|nr:hypothetical protein [Pseudomonadota bacterium]
MFKLIILLSILFLTACTDNTPPAQTGEKQPNAVEVLAKAEKTFAAISDQFKWRDTHLLIEQAQVALKNGDEQRVISLAKIIIKQSELMQAQRQFADDNWQALMPQ